MITIEQAKQLSNDYGRVHENGCRKDVGPKGGVEYHSYTWRVSGKIKTWKTRPGEFRLPIKFGLRVHDSINNGNAHLFHLASECPIEELRSC